MEKSEKSAKKSSKGDKKMDASKGDKKMDEKKEEKK